MSDIALHIEYLLSKHDCVIVPGWGAFIMQYRNAVYFTEDGIYKKPYRSISFNQSICHNDGLLINSMIRRSGIPYAVANNEIEEFVASLRKQLDYDGLVAIGRLGIFKNTDGLVIFEPNRIGDRCSDSFGLHNLKIKTLAQMTEESVASDNMAHLKSRQSINLNVRRFAQLAASIIILICAGFVLSTPLRFDQSTDYASLENAVRISQPSPKVVLNSDGDLAIALPVCAEQELNVSVNTCDEEESNKRAEDRVEARLPHDDEGEYYLIVSSLDTKEQAEKYIQRHNGDLRILERGDRFRVYAAQSASFKSLNHARKSILSEYPDAWILR